MSLFDLTGKVAVVTGSSRGIGRAIAERLAEHGAKVVVSSRKADICETVAAGIRAKGGEAAVIPCHIARKEELQKLVDQTTALWEDPVRYRKTTRDNPLQRIGEPDEIAGAAVFLASPAGSFVTGHTLVVDGGTMAGVVLQKDE